MKNTASLAATPTTRLGQRLLGLILLFALNISLFTPLAAQTVGEAFYIYRNDGQFNACFRTEIDSMAYSNYDLDSLLHDDIVTQVI